VATIPATLPLLFLLLFLNQFQPYRLKGPNYIFRTAFIAGDDIAAFNIIFQVNVTVTDFTAS